MASWLLSDGHTILGFAESGLEVVEREIAHLVFQAAQIHDCGYWARCWGLFVDVGVLVWGEAAWVLMGSAADPRERPCKRR